MSEASFHTPEKILVSGKIRNEARGTKFLTVGECLSEASFHTPEKILVSGKIRNETRGTNFFDGGRMFEQSEFSHTGKNIGERKNDSIC